MGLELDSLQRILLAGRSFWFYAAKVLWPAGLNFLYPKWNLDPAARRRGSRRPRSPRCSPGSGLRGAGGEGAAGRRALLLPAAPALVLLHVLYMMRYTLVSDHWIYFGSPALIALAVAVAVDPEGLEAGSGRLVVLVLVLGALTWFRGATFKDEATLWRATLDRNPGPGLRPTTWDSPGARGEHAGGAAPVRRGPPPGAKASPRP